MIFIQKKQKVSFIISISKITVYSFLYQSVSLYSKSNNCYVIFWKTTHSRSLKWPEEKLLKTKK